MMGAGSSLCAPWLVSLGSLLLVALLGREPALTCLILASQLSAALSSLVFSRLAAQRGCEQVLPNLIGALAATAVVSAVLAGAGSVLFTTESLAFKVVFASAFVASCQVGVVVSALSSLCAQRVLWFSVALGCAVTFGACRLLAPFGEFAGLAGFAIGQACTLFGALGALYRRAPAASGVAFDFARRRSGYLELGTLGFSLSLGLWIDKVLVRPHTAMPLVLAALSASPGLVVTLVRLEGDFAVHHSAFAAAVSGGPSLRRIEGLHVELTHAARRALADVARVQAFTLLAACLLAPALFRAAGISEQHLPQFYLSSTAVALQVLALAVVSLLAALERRRALRWLSLLLLISNAGLTHAAQRLGPEFSSLGGACALALTSVVGLVALGRAFPSLVQDTFMLRPVEP